MTCKFTTQQQKDAIAEMREAGKSYKQISLKLNIPTGTVTHICLVYGIEKPNVKALKPLPSNVYTYMRNGKPVRGFTSHDDHILLKMERAGATITDICKRLNRGHNSIQARLAILARREERKLLCSH
jgi:DNA-binding NarL/FixJ family response regulator